MEKGLGNGWESCVMPPCCLPYGAVRHVVKDGLTSTVVYGSLYSSDLSSVLYSALMTNSEASLLLTYLKSIGYFIVS